MNRFEKRQAKKLAQRKERERIADQLPAAPVPSQWVLFEREFMLKSPHLPAYQAAWLIEHSKPRYETREGFTQIF